MYQKKPSKRETQEKTKYTIHAYKNPDRSTCINPLSFLFTPPVKFYQVVSIDPATDNFAFRIERRWYNGFIEGVAFEKVKFCRNISDDGIMEMFPEIIMFLDKYKDFYRDTSLFIIERQMHINYNAIRVVHIVFGYYVTYILTSNDNQSRVLIEIDPKVKGNVLGAPKGCDKKTLKQWGIDEAKNLLRLRCDNPCINIINQHKKKDDLADTVIQIEAFFKLLGLPLTGQAYKTQIPSLLPSFINIIDDDSDEDIIIFGNKNKVNGGLFYIED